MATGACHLQLTVYYTKYKLYIYIVIIFYGVASLCYFSIASHTIFVFIVGAQIWCMSCYKKTIHWCKQKLIKYKYNNILLYLLMGVILVASSLRMWDIQTRRLKQYFVADL